ncbi:MAG: hypothetical protein EOM87_08750 [Clostridia bacterium]|nr:hypothetical protein [Clostridia bacterium]
MQEEVKKPSVVQKIKNYLRTHENIAQIIKYTVFSMLAFIVEYVSFTLLVLLLKNYTEEAVWWIFRYTTESGGMGAMIAFFVSVVLAQITAFIVNRKKTFKATNNLAFSMITYAIMVCGIIVFNTWSGAAITEALNKVIPNLTVCQYIGKLTGSFAAFVITFIMSKFIIMRNPKPKALTEETSAIK